ncbi:hypothetical protein [Neobacillus terrae]|uniref:hypothetical protein n=1 Tax=Neobacillus terrae TaxID=3034837 RepID=UPI00140BCA2D|nr:hypothetical protein [Neobacillus terrae]NHM32070.1 hypothetical protein [Neobacillus terrae]
MIIAMVSRNKVFGDKIIKDEGYAKITLYKNWDSDGPFVITDKKVIKQFIQKINSSPREELSKINFEQGPDGRIIVEEKSKVHEFKVFSNSGNVVTNSYYINTAFKLNQIFE